jgi:hypothetical protein
MCVPRKIAIRPLIGKVAGIVETWPRGESCFANSARAFPHPSKSSMDDGRLAGSFLLAFRQVLGPGKDVIRSVVHPLIHHATDVACQVPLRSSIAAARGSALGKHSCIDRVALRNASGHRDIVIHPLPRCSIFPPAMIWAIARHVTGCLRRWEGEKQFPSHVGSVMRHLHRHVHCRGRPRRTRRKQLRYR